MCFLASIIILLVGCNSTPPYDVLSRLECPEHISKFKESYATSGFVEHCMGEPETIDKHSDGRFIYLYNVAKGRISVYLFDSEHKLIKFSDYQDGNIPTARSL